MATVRDARRALDRGEVDEALLVLWNLIEPLRLEGDRAGLHRVTDLADEIATVADGAYASEAERLVAAVGRATSDEPAVTTVIGQRVPDTLEQWATVLLGGDAGRADDLGGDVRADGDEAPGEESRGRRLGPIVWAVLLGLFVLLQVLGNLFGDQ
jgi:hypothetical protein